MNLWQPDMRLPVQDDRATRHHLTLIIGAA